MVMLSIIGLLFKWRVHRANEEGRIMTILSSNTMAEGLQAGYEMMARIRFDLDDAKL